MQLQEIEVEIEKLSAHDRASLAKKIIESLDSNSEGFSEAEIEALWVEEAERRLDEMLAGTVREIAVEDALKHARNAIS